MQQRKYELTQGIGEHDLPTRFADLPVRERIKLRAFEIYKGRAGVPGSALIDWLRAEWECEGDQPRSTRN